MDDTEAILAAVETMQVKENNVIQQQIDVGAEDNAQRLADIAPQEVCDEVFATRIAEPDSEDTGESDAAAGAFLMYYHLAGCGMAEQERQKSKKRDRNDEDEENDDRNGS